MKVLGDFMHKWRYTLVIFLFGVLLIVVGNKFSSALDTNASWVREVGIAFAVAALVTFVYESKARDDFADATFQHVLERVMGDVIDTKLWEEMKEQILEKQAIRKQTNVTFAVQRPEDFPANRLVLSVNMNYRLEALRSRTKELTVLHFVDEFMRDPVTRDLPRLDRVQVGAETMPLPADGGRFKNVVPISKDRPAVPVQVDRREIVYLPGGYNLLMSELTQLELISLLVVPDDVKVTINCFFNEEPLTMAKAIRLDRYLLPGQSIEVRFELKDQLQLPKTT